jgi:nitrous oxidase accessory protein NosD
VDVVGNTIAGSTVGAIGVFGGAQKVNVVSNTVQNTVKDGIFLESGGDGLPAVGTVSVLKNAISNIGHNGIYANGVDVQVLQNVITNCSASGVYAAAGVSVIGNTISRAKPLITAEVEDNATIHDNIFPKGGDVLYLN